jgi:hypothetical protein
MFYRRTKEIKKSLSFRDSAVRGKVKSICLLSRLTNAVSQSIGEFLGSAFNLQWAQIHTRSFYAKAGGKKALAPSH